MAPGFRPPPGAPGMGFRPAHPGLGAQPGPGGPMGGPPRFPGPGGLPPPGMGSNGGPSGAPPGFQREVKTTSVFVGSIAPGIDDDTLKGLLNVGRCLLALGGCEAELSLGMRPFASAETGDRSKWKASSVWICAV